MYLFILLNFTLACTSHLGLPLATFQVCTMFLKITWLLFLKTVKINANCSSIVMEEGNRVKTYFEHVVLGSSICVISLYQHNNNVRINNIILVFPFYRKEVM